MTNTFKQANRKFTAISQHELSCELMECPQMNPPWDNSGELSMSMVLALRDCTQDLPQLPDYASWSLKLESLFASESPIFRVYWTQTIWRSVEIEEYMTLFFWDLGRMKARIFQSDISRCSSLNLFACSGCNLHKWYWCLLLQYSNAIVYWRVKAGQDIHNLC